MATRTIKAKKPKVRLVSLPIHEVHPSFENDMIYRPIDGDDPDIVRLADSIARNGLQPIIVSKDLFIVSGHRRYAACRRLGWTEIDCIIEQYDSYEPEFERKLVEHNIQRAKSVDEILRERIVCHDPDAAYSKLKAYRAEKSAVKGGFLDLGKRQKRAKLSRNKMPMLDAVKRVLAANRAYWPMTDRTIHYELLNDPPPINAKEPGVLYENSQKCYKNLCRLLTNARVEGRIDFDCIEDPTRKTNSYHCQPDAGGFLGDELETFLQGYWRDLMQSQPHHVEIVGEKNTVEASIRPIAEHYTIPYTLGRGYCSLDPRRKMYERYKAAQRKGKAKLIILILSDFDPEGENIALTFAKSMRDDFGVDVEAKKVCLTYEQVLERNLPQTFDIKKKSSRYKAHAAKYGDRAHELEALPTAERSRLLDEAIRGVIDVDAFNREVALEKQDGARLDVLRSKVGPLLREALDAQQ